MRIKLLLQIAVIVLTVGVSKAFAILNIYANANPFVTPGYDLNTTTSGTVEYTVYHEAGSTNALNYFELKFDTSIFSSFMVMSAVIDGTTSVGFSQDPLYAFSSSAFSMGTGSSMVISVAYTLLGGASTLSWPEGSPWGQSFYGSSGGGARGLYDYGSTDLAPEPGTIMLLGSGLLGLGLVRRYLRRFQKQ